MKYFSFFSACLCLFVGAALLGCSSEKMDIGVVAKVNGRPIYLNQLEAKYDLSHLGWAGNVPMSPGTLKKEYREMLNDLIAQELIFQVLEEKGFPVTEDELNRAEAQVRTDYDKGDFEKVLVEEYIALDVWRKQLLAHLSYEKLLNKILRPKISLDNKEVQTYYAKNKDTFKVPAQVSFVVVSGPNKKLVQEGVQAFLVHKDVEKLEKSHPQLAANAINTRETRLPENWLNALEKLAPNRASKVKAANKGFESLVLLGRLPEKIMDPKEAYRFIENQLLEQKLQDAYGAWLKNELNDADIQISKHLLAKVPENDTKAKERASGKGDGNDSVPKDAAKQ